MNDTYSTIMTSSVFQYKSFAAYLAKKAELRKHWSDQRVGAL